MIVLSFSIIHMKVCVSILVYTMTWYVTTSGHAVYSETYGSTLGGLCTALLSFIFLSLYQINRCKSR